jgi:hypothetical protein
MTDPTHHDQFRPPWRLALEDGDQLELRPPAEPDGQPDILLTLPPSRAWDLSTVLDRYNRLAAIFSEASDISTEESLARGLNDARAAATGRPDPTAAASKVGPAERGRAMVVLQRARPELSHGKLVAIIDATAGGWTTIRTTWLPICSMRWFPRRSASRCT